MMWKAPYFVVDPSDEACRTEKREFLVIVREAVDARVVFEFLRTGREFRGHDVVNRAAQFKFDVRG